MVINISAQHNGGLLPDIILLTQGYYHWGSRLTLSKPGTHKMDSKKGPQAIVNIYRTPNLFPITGLFVFFLH